MSISLVIGTPKHGKTYLAVKDWVLPAADQSRAIVTNIPLDIDKLKVDYPDLDVTYIDKDAYKSGDFTRPDVIRPGAVYLLDEIYMFLPKGKRVDQIPDHIKEFFAQHAHYNDGKNTCEIVMLTQDPETQMSKFAASLVEYTYIITKRTGLGKTAANYYSVQSINGPWLDLLRQPPKEREIGLSAPAKYDPDVYQYYKSQSLSNTTASVNSSRSPTIFTPFRIGLFVLALGLVAYNSHGLYKLFNPDPEVTSDSVATDAVSPARTKPVDTFQLLSHVDTVRITYCYALNGLLPTCRYRFTFADSSIANLTTNQLDLLDVTVDHLDYCFAVLSDGHTKSHATCTEADPLQDDQVSALTL